MKMMKTFLGAAAAVFALSGCMKNQDIELPDYVKQTTYFASQFPIRTIVLGEDLFVDNSLDNQHKFSLKATTGGVRENTKDIELDYNIDASLCTNLYFSADRGNGKVVPLPASYYQLPSNKIIIPKGSILGGMDIQLTDAFFADPLAIGNTYALPVRLSAAKGADSILKGRPAIGVTIPNPLIDAHWAVKPKDFTVFALKFVNTWHGNYLRRGKDVITGSVNSTIVRHGLYVENDEINKLSTRALTVVDFPVVVKNAAGTNISVPLLLTFDNSGNCTVSSNNSLITAAGTGKFVSKGDKNSWGGKDRDAMYLDYNINITAQNIQVKTVDTLVMRDRAVAAEYYTPVVR